MLRLMYLFVCVLSIGVLVFESGAAAIEISYPSFEMPALSDGGSSSSVPGWVLTGGMVETRNLAVGEVVDPNGFAADPDPATDGDQVVKISNNGEIRYHLDGYELVHGDNWTISVDLLLDSNTALTIQRFMITTVENPTAILPTASRGFVNSHGTWQNASISFTVNSTWGRDGETPMIVLNQEVITTGSNPGYFDNVRGTTTASYTAPPPTVPEPGSLIGMLGLMGVLVGRKRGTC